MKTYRIDVNPFEMKYLILDIEGNGYLTPAGEPSMAEDTPMMEFNTPEEAETYVKEVLHGVSKRSGATEYHVNNGGL